MTHRSHAVTKCARLTPVETGANRQQFRYIFSNCADICAQRSVEERRMGRGGGSAGAALLLAVAVALHCCSVAVQGSAIYVVGDGQGWGFQSYALWTEGKRFRAGDTLVFNYAPGAHNVVPVNANGYRACRAPGGARPLTSGSDRVTLTRGFNYYICTYPGHCAAGMKIAIRAA